MSYRILLRPAAVRDLDGLPSKVRARVEDAVETLRDNPRPPGTRKLVGFNNEWRLRIGSYRVLYLINDQEQSITIARVAHRREAYR